MSQQPKSLAPAGANEIAKGSETEPTDAAVIAYLQKRGLGSAVLELRNILTDPNKELSNREKIELDDAVARNQRTLLSRTTGGGFGYDADSARAVAQWGVPDNNALSDPKKGSLSERLGQDEAKAYLESFTALQLWVLSLPDDPAMIQPIVNPVGTESTGISIASIAKRAAGTLPDDRMKDVEALQNQPAIPWMPPSCKPELLAVSFALLVQTYCELLEVGMESTAQSLLTTFRPVYDPLYVKEIADVERCKTTEDVMRLNSYNTQHTESLATLKACMVQVANFQARKEEFEKENSASARKHIAECDQNITLLQQKYQEMSKRASTAFLKMKDYPFLRRARAVRWQIVLSASSYAMLAAYLSSQESLLPMSAMLQTKCELHVERRDPLPYTPAIVLDDDESDKKEESPSDVQWAVPVPPAVRLAEAGEDALTDESERLPFPKHHLDSEFDSGDDAEKAKKVVKFNRALLINGFRRLEALERKREYDVDGYRGDEQKKNQTPILANPLKPTILQYTLCSSASSGTVLPARIGSANAASIWSEPGVGITCAKMCNPDGRRVAAGCDDGAVRIWSLYESTSSDKTNDQSKSEYVSETAIVLLGHKNGFPVFDVDWNRDGRTLFSAGGDGSVRLWDTMAVGPYGASTKVTKRTTPIPSTNIEKEQERLVPGLRPESMTDASGAALAVYRGHSPSCPIWSVASSPSGYYFATAASDATARIWTTDRPAPVRILAGHTNSSVNCVTWHPNCNYVLTGCDDKTVRMWDVQNGRCVRLLTGCAAGVNVVRVCPSGRYAVGADYCGVVHVWDLGTGKKVNELRPPSSSTKRDAEGLLRVSAPIIHSVAYSACGSALATGGDDCIVRVWDVRGIGKVGKEDRPGLRTPSHSFPTMRTSVLDLRYTKRNLLMSLGKYTTPVPLAVPIQ